MIRCCCLSGGGAKGAYQVGALKKWMYEDGIEYDAFCGISVGSINSSFLAQYPYGNPQKAWVGLNSLWGRVSNANIKKNWFLFGPLASLWKPSVYNSEPLKQWIQSELNPQAISTSGKKLRVVAVSWDTAKSHTATEEDPEIAKWVCASSAYPVMFLHEDIGGEQWSDGGLRSVTPLGEAIRLGADEVDIIMCSNPDSFSGFDHKKSAITGRLMRSLDIFVAQIEVADFKMCGVKNDLSELKPEYRKVKLRLLQPKKSIGDSLNFDQDKIQEMMALGYSDACALGNG